MSCKQDVRHRQKGLTTHAYESVGHKQMRFKNCIN